MVGQGLDFVVTLTMPERGAENHFERIFSPSMEGTIQLKEVEKSVVARQSRQKATERHKSKQ